MEERYDCPKMTPKQWIANFWYYYRWLFIVVVVFLIMILISTVQFLTKEEPDASILIVGQVPIGENVCEDILESSRGFLFDVNSDGEIEAELKTFTLSSDYGLLTEKEQIELNRKYQNYSDEILGGDSYVLILDLYFYEELVNSGSLVHLAEVFGDLPQEAFDYYGIRLGDSPLYRLPGFSQLPGEMVLCLKHISPVFDATEEEKIDLHLNNLELFRCFYQGTANS